MSPNKAVKGDTQNAEFWMKMGLDLGEIKTSVNDVKASLSDFIKGEFQSMKNRQDKLDEKLSTMLTKTIWIIAGATVGWTVTNILLHLFKVL